VLTVPPVREGNALMPHVLQSTGGRHKHGRIQSCLQPSSGVRVSALLSRICSLCGLEGHSLRSRLCVGAQMGTKLTSTTWSLVTSAPSVMPLTGEEHVVTDIPNHVKCVIVCGIQSEPHNSVDPLVRVGMYVPLDPFVPPLDTFVWFSLTALSLWCKLGSNKSKYVFVLTPTRLRTYGSVLPVSGDEPAVSVSEGACALVGGGVPVVSVGEEACALVLGGGVPAVSLGGEEACCALLGGGVATDSGGVPPVSVGGGASSLLVHGNVRAESVLFGKRKRVPNSKFA
jgi:hypothetical protein